MNLFQLLFASALAILLIDDSHIFEALEDPKALKQLIAEGLNVNEFVQRPASGWSGIHAIGGNKASLLHFTENPKSIGVLMDAGADPFADAVSWSMRSEDGSKVLLKPLDVAFFYGKPDAAMALISHPRFRMDGTREQQELFDGYLFQCLGMENSSDLAELLLNKGADHQAVFNGFTTLEANWSLIDNFQRKGDTRNEECHLVAKLLIEKGAKPELMTAVMFDDHVTALAMLEKGIKLRHEELHGIAVVTCIKNRQPLILEGLLDTGIKIEDGFLCRASSLGDASIVDLLLQRGADANETSLGTTPLHCAVWSNNATVIEALLRNGANPNAKNSRQKTPVESCRDMKKRNELKKLFQKHAAVLGT